MKFFIYNFYSKKEGVKNGVYIVLRGRSKEFLSCSKQLCTISNEISQTAKYRHLNKMMILWLRPIRIQGVLIKQVHSSTQVPPLHTYLIWLYVMVTPWEWPVRRVKPNLFLSFAKQFLPGTALKSVLIIITNSLIVLQLL